MHLIESKCKVCQSTVFSDMNMILHELLSNINFHDMSLGHIIQRAFGMTFIM